jgi:snRNA-activating protein complex (SNAPc), subunit 3
LTTDNEFVPHDPAYFCNNCFRSFNFVEGKKICDFTSYPLVDRKDFPDKDVTDPLLVPPEVVAMAGTSGEAQVHPLLFAPRNTHRELVVNSDSLYPPSK